MLNEFDLNFAKKITNADRLAHHLSECNDATIKAIKEFFNRTPKTAKIFARATHGWA